MPKRPRADRAAQFMPFAALRGYYDLLRTKERVPEPRHELTEEEARELSAVAREVREELGIVGFEPEAVAVYPFRSEREYELVHVFRTVYDGEVRPSDELDGGRFWTAAEILENRGKGLFTPNFEGEVSLILK